MMRQFDDPDQAVSWAAILIFFSALRPVIQLLSVLFSSPSALTRIPTLLYFGAVAAAVVGAAFMLKQRRWAWPVTVAGVVLGTVFDLLFLPSQGIFGLLGLAFDALVLYLLFRPAVRQRFGVGQR
jgi:hypothetical protein